MATNYPGIDYSLGKANYDIETGISYGLIDVRSLTEWIWEYIMPVYLPYCPHCYNELPISFEDDTECPDCKVLIEDGQQYSDFAEPSYLEYKNDEYHLYMSSDSQEVWIFKSPYFTYAQYCSPCMPGAGNLDVPMDERGQLEQLGAKTYCLDKTWFNDEMLPYPINTIGE